MNLFRPIAVLAFFLTSLSAWSQDLIPQKWEGYGIAIDVPQDFVVNDKQTEGFYAYNDYVSLSLRPWVEPYVTEENLSDLAVSKSMEMGYSEVLELEKMSIEGFTGYSTYALKGETYCSLGFLKEKGTPVQFIMIVCYDEGWIEIAKHIFSSLRRVR